MKMSESTLVRMKKTMEEKGASFEVLEHDPVFTSAQAARSRKGALHSGVKALVLKNENGVFVVALVAADKKVDLKKLAKTVGFKELNLAPKEEVLKATDCEVGSVPPFGFPKPLATYVDQSVFDNEVNEFNAGLHTVSIRLPAKELRKVLVQKLLDFSMA
ncbi:MAG: hypothetical protein HY393_00455 [Candidatus Diapherotrites archaeon]|nr:hypothetical protein [Candidatus Diapherotrites archaeon]